MKILGVHCGHDSSAALIVDGEIVANVQEERLTRTKHDTSFPHRAVSACLALGGLSSEEIDVLAIPCPYIPPVFNTFFTIPDASRPAKKAGLKTEVRRKLLRQGPPEVGKPYELPHYHRPFALSDRCRVHLCEHHRAHAASAYYTSGLAGGKTLIVTMDGVGGSVSAAVWVGENGTIFERYRVDGSGSLGWFYSNVTEALGWRHGSGEWKVMGLAPYGRPVPGVFDGFHPEYEGGRLKTPHDFGIFSIWDDHGAYHYHGRDVERIHAVISKMAREDAAAEAQRVVEEQAMRFIRPWLEREGVTRLCCAGGFFLNVKFNQKLWYTGTLDTQWIYPDCGDGGLPVGAALDAHHAATRTPEIARIDHLYWGPEYGDAEIRTLLEERGLDYAVSADPAADAARYLAENRVVGWFQGRMESGPRALGNRSILMSPLKKENKDIINAKVKYREKFRPFCPSMLMEARDDYLVNARDERYMVTSFDVAPKKKGRIPAVVHEDQTARPQMVEAGVNPLYHRLIREFARRTGEAVILNTSFNIRGEPIVCHPREAIRCFFDTGLDVLFLGGCVVEKPQLRNGGKKG